MKKEEIIKRIKELKTEEEIRKFVEERLEELESEITEEKTVGQNYTDSFREFIGKKIHYKAADRLGEDECPDLVYDDIIPYIELVKAIKTQPWYNEFPMFTDTFFLIRNYLPSSGVGIGRWFAYSACKDIGKISIKVIKEREIAFCSENAGLAHNLFKFMRMDSEVVVGLKDGDFHAYNLVFPNGYDKGPVILYDPTHFVNFVKGNQKYSFGFYQVLYSGTYQEFLTGKPLHIDLSETEANYRKVYGYNGLLDDFEFQNVDTTYVYGLQNAKQIKESENKL